MGSIWYMRWKRTVWREKAKGQRPGTGRLKAKKSENALYETSQNFNSEPQNIESRTAECRRVESLCSVFLKIDRIPYFDIRYSLFDIHYSLFESFFSRFDWTPGPEAALIRSWSPTPDNTVWIRPEYMQSSMVSSALIVYFCMQRPSGLPFSRIDLRIFKKIGHMI